MVVHVGGRGPGHTVRSQSSWYMGTAFAALAAVADFNNDRYALPNFGPELITNGTFDTTTTGWSATSSNLSSVSGRLRMANAGAVFGYGYQGITTTPGKTYRLQLTGYTGTQSPFYNVGNSINGAFIIGNTALSNGVPTTVHFTAVGFTTYLALKGSGSTDTQYAEFDNVSIVEIQIDRPDIGAELLQSGDFAASTGWTLKTPAVGTETMTISGGTLNLTGDGTNAAYADQSITTVASTRYRVICTAATNTATVQVGTTQGGTTLLAASTAAVGLNVYFFTATGTTTWLRISRTATGVSAVDNASIKAVGTVAYVKRPATFDEWLAFTAASTTARTYTASDGTQKNDLAANAPRFDYANGKRQLRLENAATNLLLNSDTLATQSVAVTAQAYTLSFQGTGTVTLSGTSTAGPLVGTGVDNRVPLTFTPTAGTLTLTVSGSVTRAQLEAGTFASNYISTAGSAVTRAIESAALSALMLGLGQRGAGSWAVRAQLSNTSALSRRLIGSDTTGAPLLAPSGTTTVAASNASVTLTATLGSGSTSAAFGAATAYDGAGRAVVGNGGTVASDTNLPNTRVASYLARSATVDATNAYGDGSYDFVGWSPERLSNADLQALAVAA